MPITKYITNTSIIYVYTYFFKKQLVLQRRTVPYRTCQTAQVHRTVRTREVGVAVECSSSGSSRVGQQQGVRCKANQSINQGGPASCGTDTVLHYYCTVLYVRTEYNQPGAISARILEKRLRKRLRDGLRNFPLIAHTVRHYLHTTNCTVLCCTGHTTWYMSASSLPHFTSPRSLHVLSIS